jgi:hypothetical protein
MVTDWGVPDWQLQDLYLSPAGRSRMLVWAWQFLRRNPEYRAYWQEKVQPLIEEDGALGGSCGGVIDEVRRTFGLLLPTPPAMPNGAHFAAVGVRRIQAWASYNPNRLEPFEVGYIFDMTLPLGGQFAQALKDAKLFQKNRAQEGILTHKNPRETSKKYATYLRILDADDAGADQKTIENTLFPELNNHYPEFQRTKALRNHRKAAQRLRDTDYRLLAALAVASSNSK